MELNNFWLTYPYLGNVTLGFGKPPGSQNQGFSTYSYWEKSLKWEKFNFSHFNKIKRICKFASRFCKVSCALQGVLGIILILQGIAKKKLQRF